MGFRGVGETAGAGASAGVLGDGECGTIVNGSRNRGIQRRALRHDGWTKPRRAQFLRALGTTCNVRASAASVGLALSGAYALRLRDPVFAASWAAALASGYDRLEEALLAAAIAGLSGDWGDETRAAAAGGEFGTFVGTGVGAGVGTGVGDDVAGRDGHAASDMRSDAEPNGVPVTGPDTGFGTGLGSGLGTGVVRLASMQAVQVALAMLGRYRAAQAEGGKRQKTRHRRASPEETNASIGRKLDALAKRLAVADLAANGAAAPVAVIVLGGASGDGGAASAACLPGPVAVIEKGVRHER